MSGPHSIKFEPMTQWDYENNLNGSLKSSFTTSALKTIRSALYSPIDFGDYGSCKNEIYYAAKQDNVRKFIKLIKPVPNYMICRTDGALFCKIVGISKSLFKDIVNFDLVYSKSMDALIKMEEADDIDDILAGGEILKHYIDELSDDLSVEIGEAFLDIARDVLCKKKIADAKVYIGKVDKEPKGIELVGGWYLHLDIPTGKRKDFFKKDLTDPNVLTHVLKNSDYLAQSEPRITFLLNTTKERLRAFYLERISILPAGMRPIRGDKDIDQFSYAYGKVISANNNLEQKIVNKAALKHILNHYRSLSDFATKLLAISDPRNINTFSIKERMQGKKGLIREKMIGKRSDYTGRSVILIEPDLDISQCMIPEKMLPNLYSYHLLRTKELPMETIFDPTKVDVVVNKIKELKLLDRIPPLLNRAPTLQPQSYQSYYALPTKSKAIKVNALVCVGYNADFDGDQMAVKIPINNEAIEESKHLMMGPHNIFKVGTGECLLTPRLEMIYGLFMCTRGIYKVKETPVGIFGSDCYNELYELMISYKIKIWDTVEFDGELMTAGNALVLSALPKHLDIPIAKFNMNEIDCHLSTWVGLPKEEFDNRVSAIVELSRRMYDEKASERAKDLDDFVTFINEYREFCKDKDRTRLKYFGKEKFGDNWESEVSKSIKVIQNINNLIDNDIVRVEPEMTLNSIEEFFVKLKEDTQERARMLQRGEKIPPTKVFLEYKTIVYFKGKVGRAGNLILKEVLKESILPTITKRSINVLVDRILNYSLNEFKDAIQKFCLIGFKIGKVYTPTLSVLGNIDKEKLRKPFEEFYEKIEPKRKLYKYGFETDTSYNMIFNTYYKEAEDKIKSILMDTLDEDNGFKLLVESGARGDINNLLQMMSHKGRISKANGEAFSSVILNALLDQLTSLEHMISAYGSREGLLDKSVKPGETGYLQRLIWHTTGDIIISTEDCGTKEGITYKLSDLVPFETGASDATKQVEEAKKTLRKMILGRYEAGTNIYIDSEYADRLVERCTEVTIRSPLKCKDPCCAKCYGDDLLIDGHSVVGTPVGIQTGQAIGEPLTQTTMKKFQKGGVASGVVASSPFDRLRDLIKMVDITDKPDRPNYDPIAWETGTLETETSTTYPSKYVVKIINPKTDKPFKGSILVDKKALLKKEVVKGEGISLSRGDYDMGEYIRYNDFDDAMKYHALSMYYQCKDDAGVNFKHFEMLTSCMVMYLVTDTDGVENDLKIGQLYTNTEIIKRVIGDNTKVVRVMKGVLDVPLLRESCVENINMENIQKGFSRAVILGNSDDLDGPIRSWMFGIKPKIGLEANPNYIEDRRRNMRCSY